MITLVYLILFIGMFMIVHGIYEEKYDRLKNDVRVKYKFIPRTYYDDYLMGSNELNDTKNAMFDFKQDTRSAGLPVR